RAGGRRLDLGGHCVVPSFVDPHTHVLFAGDRVQELPAKVRGVPYGEIARQGGGLYSTVRATRRASRTTLLTESLGRLDRMAADGSATVEVKSGYALSVAGEIRLLELVPILARRSRLRLVPTFLGAHAIPPEFRGRGDAYLDLLIRRALPIIARRRLARYCDVFCEPGFFSVPQAGRLLRAAAKLGLGTKVHADEFVLSGGAQLAASLSATSAEHLLATGPEDHRRLAEAGVTAVLLPATPFASLAGSRSPGRELVDAGVPVALGSDCSPNSWIESMPLVLAFGVYGGRLTPAEALTAATVNAAHAVGADNVAGRIAVGRPAECVAFDSRGIEEIAYRIGLRPSLILRQGIMNFSR
ncbi:MAG: imidazolonepropionase, partial [Thermoplasmata archaeon]|nr:imidazolonepropionase [Thermoplasmata archaeon]